MLSQCLCLAPPHVGQVGILIHHPYVVVPLPMPDEVYLLHHVQTHSGQLQLLYSAGADDRPVNGNHIKAFALPFPSPELTSTGMSSHWECCGLTTRTRSSHK